MNTMSPIHAARQYVLEAVLKPALESSLPKSTKAKIRNSNIWLNQFKRVGDLYAYLKRFNADKKDGIYLELKALGLQTFEDIVQPFEMRFGDWVGDRMRASDFVIGETYSAHDILIFSGSYDTRAGGMFVIQSDDEPTAVVIKATLSGGRYANEWLDQGRRLKYFLKSKTLKDGSILFGEHYRPNAAILKVPSLPVLAFVRQTAQGDFVYAGVFSKQNMQSEPDGSKWFDLVLASTDDVIADAEYIQRELQDHVAMVLTQSRQQRLMRLAKAPKKPKTIRTVTTAFVRNPDVIAEVLLRANGQCEECNKTAPFVSKATGELYLEVHHRKPLARGGDDTVANALALCPNCHREKHFG
jgi:5-methylcytosine-specific restriction protein A